VGANPCRRALLMQRPASTALLAACTVTEGRSGKGGWGTAVIRPPNLLGKLSRVGLFGTHESGGG